uniref:Prenyltransferase alpha-alpha toroid domain-containing protein n=1 Tax=Physcomitrium patens TaxID=3218 RepID=A0A7I4B6A1_PHYPA
MYVPEMFCVQIPAVNIIEWICSLQVLPLAADHPSSSVNKIFGFRGSLSIVPSNFYDEGHSASTYLAQCILRILGDNLSCVEAEAILSTVHDPQQPDDSEICYYINNYCSEQLCAERDLRFTYCAVFLLHSILKNVHDAAEGFVWVYVKVATICSLLNGWRGMIVEKSVSHILSCQSYEDAFGLYPDLEAHGAFINLFSVKCPYLDDCRHILT